MFYLLLYYLVAVYVPLYVFWFNTIRPDLHMLIYYEFLRTLLFLEIWIINKVDGVGNAYLNIYVICLCKRHIYTCMRTS